MDILRIPERAGQDLRHRLGLSSDAPLRISYLAGPGDVVGTYEYWKQGLNDPRKPIVTYSTMFYELMAQLDAQAQVVTFFPSPKAPQDRFTFTQVTPGDWSGRVSYFKSRYSYGKDLIAAVSAYDPHVVVAHSDVPHTTWPALARGRKLVLSAHNTFWPMGQTPSSLKDRIKTGWLQRNAGALDGAVCISAECMRQIQTLTRGRITGHVVHPQIDKASASAPAPSARKLMYLGRIEANKGIFMLLDAFKALQARVPDLSLVFAGGGSADDALAEAITALGSPDVQAVGMLDAQQVQDHLTASDILVCPTTSQFNEGLATTGLEAAARGVPSVLSSVVPAAELLGDSCRVFRADDTDDLTRKLAELIEDDAAYAACVAALSAVQDNLYDRSQSWGSRLNDAFSSV